jgi:hypothetical protein
MIRPKPHAHGQKVAHADRPPRGHGVVERPVGPRQDLAPRQLRQQPVDRLIEPQPAFLYQDHRRDGRDRLGHRGDAKDRIVPHRRAAGEVLRADRIEVRLAGPAHGGDDAGRRALLDVARQDVVHALEPRLRQAAFAHRPPPLAIEGFRSSGKSPK